MDNLHDLQKEEFIQCYLQYRWLDDTRTKYVDRFFIILFAVLVTRFQFATFFQEHICWLLLLYAIFSFISVLMAKSVVSFRRQQKGHGRYIKAMREYLLKSNSNNAERFKDYIAYINGKSIHVTKWIELILVIIAVFSPFLMLEVVWKFDFYIRWVIMLVLFLISVGLVVFLIVPFWLYNFAKEINWQKR